MCCPDHRHLRSSLETEIILAKQLIQDTIERVRLRLLHERAMILFDLSQVGNKIRFVRSDPFGPLDKLPCDEKCREDENPIQISAVSSVNKMHGYTHMRYQNKNDGTSQAPFKKTGYPPTNAMTKVATSP